MPIPANLTTNEVKDAAGTEVEFNRLSTGEGRQALFANANENPMLQHRIVVKHQEIGTGIRRHRRSAIRVEKTSIADLDSATPVTSSATIVLDAPIGAISDMDDPKLVLANLISFIASKGASTTILYDCTGYGAESLIAGTL